MSISSDLHRTSVGSKGDFKTSREVQIPHSVWMVIHSTIYLVSYPDPLSTLQGLGTRLLYIMQATSLIVNHTSIYICAYLHSQDGKRKKKCCSVLIACRVDKQTSNPLVKCSAAFLTTSHWTPFLMLQGNDACLPFNHDCSQPRPSHCPV